MTPRASIATRSPAPRGRRAPRGAATVELAILAPILVVLVLWANYFWELQRTRIKGAELARYVAFERTVKANPAAIAAEAQERYRDLDGSTPTGDLGTAFRNRLTLTVQAQDANAPLHLTAAPAGIFVNMMGFDPGRGAVETTVQINLQNAIIPEQVAFYTTGPENNRLDLNFREGFYLVHDTWRAWKPNDQPAQTYPTVESNTHERVRRIAYLNLGGNGVMNAIGSFLSVLGLDFPFSTSYIRASVLVRPVPQRGYFYPQVPLETRTVPGDVLQAGYWLNDNTSCFGNCEPTEIQQKRGLINRGDRGDNWPMRSYNCRGDFFQGAILSNAPESLYSQQGFNEHGNYHRYGNTACQ
jgi:Flp pilus assembly protein TadG